MSKQNKTDRETKNSASKKYLVGIIISLAIMMLSGVLLYNVMFGTAETAIQTDAGSSSEIIVDVPEETSSAESLSDDQSPDSEAADDTYSPEGEADSEIPDDDEGSSAPEETQTTTTTASAVTTTSEETTTTVTTTTSAATTTTKAPTTTTSKKTTTTAKKATTTTKKATTTTKKTTTTTKKATTTTKKATTTKAATTKKATTTAAATTTKKATTTAKASSGGSTPVAKNGKLKVSGANIVNKNGDKFQIKGMSTHGIMWESFSDILTKESLKVLRDDWKVNTIRIAMYTEEWGGYTTGSDYASQAKKKVDTGVQNATDLGMYVIIDWHILNDGDPKKHQSEAVSFFTEMAKKYKDYDNVLYEICNEPNGSNVTWSGNIKPYAEKVVSAIRKYDSDAIIIVGTGTWSQDIDKVVGNTLSDKNCVYSLHFYANTHTDWLRTRFTDCYNKGLPILVSEFGTCDASGNGGFNKEQTKKWIELLNSKKVGYINWSLANKNETASAFKSGTNLAAIKSGTDQLTESGKLVRELYRK